MMNKVIEKVIDTIEKNNMLNNNEHIVLGLSGGPDSVCLFHVLLKLKDEYNLTLYPVHVNHKFRPGDAEKDQKYVEELCESYGIQCRSFEVDCLALARERRISSEEAGRIARYEAFEEVCREVEKGVCSNGTNSVKIAVAQNADDRAETVLFRLLRGTGTDGISSIKYVRRDKKHRIIIRPLLDVYKKDILLYCEAENLRPCFDKTNAEPIYTRNKIRLELIPYLEREFNGNVKEALNRLADAALSDRLYLEKVSGEALSWCTISHDEHRLVLDGEKLKSLDIAIRRRVVGLGLVSLGLSSDVTSAHYEACEEILANANPSASTDLPKGYYFRRLYDDVELGFTDERISREEECLEKRVSIISREDFEKMDFAGKRFCTFDYEALQEEFGHESVMTSLCLRKKREGDVLALQHGTKKVKRILVDDKVPAAYRDKVLVLAIGEQVLWLKEAENRYRYTAKYKVNNRTKNVICIEFLSAT